MENSTFFDRIESEAQAYWLGFLFADGCLFKSGKQVSVLLSERDRDHLEHLAALFTVPVRSSSNFDARTGKTYHRARLVLSSTHLWQSLHEKGFRPAKSLIETAEPLGHVPPALARHFVRGLFDGDGSVGRYGVGNRASFRATLSGTGALLEGVQQLMAQRLGLRSNQIDVNGRIRALHWAGVWALQRIRWWFYKDATICLDRKRAIFDQIPLQRGTSRFIGVYCSQRSSEPRWIARLFRDGKTRHIGAFKDEIEAARAYDEEVLRVYGAGANLNFPMRDVDGLTPALIADFSR